MHNVPFLWRWFHQMHHSAERLDIPGAVYFHPFDMLGWAFLGSLVLVGCATYLSLGQIVLSNPQLGVLLGLATGIAYAATSDYAVLLRAGEVVSGLEVVGLDEGGGQRRDAPARRVS